MAKPAWRRQIRFLDAYKRQQESIEGGKIDPFLFKVLSGDEGGVRLGSGFTEEEKTALAFLGNERSRRQALKRQFEIADKTKEYGSTGARVGPQGKITQSKDDQIKYTGAATGSVVAAGAATGAATVGVTTGSYAFGAALGAGTFGAVAAPIAAVAIAIMAGIGEHEKKQAKKKKKKLRSLGAAQALARNVRGFTSTGALLSREGAMRIARSKVKDVKAK